MSNRFVYLHYLYTESASLTSLPIAVDDVIYFQSDDAHTAVVTSRGRVQIHTPLHELIALLDPRQFRQVQRSTVVNVDRIESVTRTDRDQVAVKLKERDECFVVNQPFCNQFLEQ